MEANGPAGEKLKYWDILSSGGDGWGVEKPPLGCDNLSENCETVNVSSDIITHNSCFVTSYYSCTKKQLIDLRKEGIYPEVIDKLQPRITISDWCSGRFDCGAIYDLKVTLLNENLETVADFEVRKHVGAADGTQWVKVSHVFTNYGPGVKFIEFYHGGMDSQFWKGHYGSKMTGSTVTVSFE
ncbi:hypothetical protein RUM44_013403 [Polyplax serrata]|uniref:FBA domain-containing protein n=1 Tax=Polyplax serrata TaxID=468196 RepID=A0ABR1BE31_POLSC